MEIRTFGEERSSNLVESIDHDNRARSLLESLGFKWKSGPVLLDTTIDVYSGPGDSRAQIIKRYVAQERRVGSYYQVIGPLGIADNTIESIRSLSKRDGYQEIGSLTDRFSGLK